MSTLNVDLEVEMLKALYDFAATFAKTMSFHENDHFVLHQKQTKKRNWWQVVNCKGQVGYIPSNYITTVKVHPDFLVDFLNGAIDSLKRNHDQQDLSMADKKTIIDSLLDKRYQVEVKVRTILSLSSPCNEFMPPIPSYNLESSNSTNIILKSDSLTESQEKSLPEEPTIERFTKIEPSKSLSKQNEQNIYNSINSSETISQCSNKSYSNEINPKFTYKLVDQVRKNTQLSHKMSKVAVTIVLNEVKKIFPVDMAQNFDDLLFYLQNPLNISKLSIEDTHDAGRLKIIFTELTSCKEDSQQRSWMLYEDEPTIIEYINELISILTNADANISRFIIRQHDYMGVTTLIEYYQMETRWTIRQLLLQAFGVMCGLDSIIITVLLNSILPMELARDMISNQTNVSKLNYSATLLLMIFSMGEPMPITHSEILNAEFITFLLDVIENPLDSDIEDQISDIFINLILSFNLQFISSENIVIEALKKLSVAKVFTEKILFLLNRETDPVRIFDHEPIPPNSVLKLFIDVFESNETASLFYTNDIKVLVDILLRQLVDVLPGMMRRQYLELCRKILKTSNYNEHLHRIHDMGQCFERILKEELQDSFEDQKLVRKIKDQFTHLFEIDSNSSLV